MKKEKEKCYEIKRLFGCYYFFLIMATGFVITVLNENINPAESKVVFDALQYEVQDEKISQKQN